MEDNKQFIRIKADAFGEAAIWKPYRMSIEEGFVYLDREKLEANSELMRLLGERYRKFDAGSRSFSITAPPPAPRKPPTEWLIPKWLKDRESKCLSCEHCAKPVGNKPYCQLVELKNKGRSLIHSGIRRKNLKCPVGRWDRVSQAELDEHQLQLEAMKKAKEAREAA